VRNAGIVFGALLVLAGAVFFGQGLGYIKGSSMTGDPRWVPGGLLFVAVGAAVVFAALRRRRE
jgi:hypothetical protein